jgi:putative membrane protein
MDSRFYIVSLGAAVILTGTMWAQAPGGMQPPQPGGGPMGTPTPIGAPGATTMPDQQQAPVDRLASDKRFVKSATERLQTEADLAKLAQEKGSSDKVKEFSRRVVEQQSKASEALKQAAAKESIPASPETLNRNKKAEAKLSKLSGADFDRAYLKLMLKDNKSDVKDFDNEARTGQASQLKNFAAQTLPEQQENLRQAEQLEASLR